MMELTYTQKGKYLYPNLVLPEQETLPLGKYGRMRKRYLKQNRKATYNRLLLSGQLDVHLQEIEQTAQRRLEQMMEEMSRAYQVDEALKEANPMEWVGQMNNLKAMAEKTILQELIYA